MLGLPPKRLFLNLLFGVALIFVSCSKNGPQSSEKELKSVMFKASDNGLLIEDINGTITGGSIEAKLPQGVSLNGLKPTFDFTGASISPANKAPQNFTNPVTYTITAQDGSTRSYSFNCTYRNHDDTVSMIRVKWGVIKDSVTNVGNYYSPTGGIPTPGVYIGQPNDYYDFKSNGNLEVFENNIFYGGAPYQILTNGRISIDAGFNYECAIQYLSATRMTLYWAFTSGNGGQYSRTLYLKR